MKNLYFISGMLLVLLLSSCSKKIYLSYQEETANTGSIFLLPARPVRNTFLSIDNKILIRDTFAELIAIYNVPEGSHAIQWISGYTGFAQTMDVNLSFDVKRGETIRKLVPVPPESNLDGYWIYLSLSAWLFLYPH